MIGANVDPKSYEAIMGHRYEEGRRTYAEVIGEKMEEAAALLGRPGLSIAPVQGGKAKG